jgi:hypothetical protein
MTGIFTHTGSHYDGGADAGATTAPASTPLTTKNK